MMQLKDYVLVKTDDAYEAMASPLIHRPVYNDTLVEANRHRRIYAEVVSVPFVLSELKLRMVDPGKPYPRAYIGEYEILNGIAEVDEYNPAGYEPEWEKLSDYALDVQVGDTVYFHFHTLLPKNQLEIDQQLLYQVRYDQLYCRVRNGAIAALCGHVLLEPEVITEEQTRTKSGLYTQVGDKPKYLLGFVRHIEEDNDLGLKPGDKVVYVPNSDFINVIEGKEYYVMHQRDVMLKVMDNGK